MIADTLDELHRFAALVGLKREWFQDVRIPHYDLCESNRLAAIRLGAIEITTRELVRIHRRNDK